MRMYVIVRSAGFSLLEIVVYMALVLTCLTALLPAGYQLLRESGRETQRLTKLSHHAVLDLQLGKFFACGRLSHITEATAEVNCLSHTEQLIYGADGALLLIRSTDTAPHALTLERLLERDGVHPLFTHPLYGASAVQVRGMYEGELFSRTYYAASEF